MMKKLAARGGERRWSRDLYTHTPTDYGGNLDSVTIWPPTSIADFFLFTSFLSLSLDRANNNRASSSNEHHHFEISLNPHEIDSEFHSDDNRQNSEGGGNIEFVRYFPLKLT